MSCTIGEMQDGAPLLRTGESSQASARHQGEKPQLTTVPTPPRDTRGEEASTLTVPSSCHCIG